MAESLVRELIDRPAHPLPPEDSFDGCGVYALYYAGDFGPYRALAERAATGDGHAGPPIYVGKAVPSGARKGLVELEVPAEPNLYRRLREHARSIDEAENLELDAFHCRYLITAPVWIRLAENLMLARYQPLWNSFLDGFGIHDPGSGRYDQARSRWDTMHPGRRWADRVADPTGYSAESLEEEVRRILAGERVADEPADVAGGGD